MLEEIDGHYMLILGFDMAQVTDPTKMLERLRSSFPSLQIQFLKADLIAGLEHLLFAARNALQAFNSGRGRSKSLAVEFLLYASCQHQISRAIDMLGIVPDDRRISVVALSDSKNLLQESSRAIESEIGGDPDDSVIEIDTGRKAALLKRVYHIAPREVEAARFPGEKESDVLKRLVIERSALLALGS